MASNLLPLLLVLGGLLLAFEGLARVTWQYSLLGRRKVTTPRAERRRGPQPRKDAVDAGLVALGLTLATIGLFLYL